MAACTFQKYCSYEKKLCNSKLCTLNIWNYVLPNCKLCTPCYKSLHIFEVLQMSLYSRILKVFASYMENFYRIPSFERTYLKI